MNHVVSFRRDHLEPNSRDFSAVISEYNQVVLYGVFCTVFIVKSLLTVCHCRIEDSDSLGLTFPSWASLIVCPVDVVRRRLFPPNVLRPLIRLARPPAPWAAPPGDPAAIAPGAAALTMWPSSSVTKKVDHMLQGEEERGTKTTQTGSA